MWKICMTLMISGLLCAAGDDTPAIAGCNAVVWRQYEDTRLWRLPGKDAYFYEVDRMKIDADGAPNAYAPRDKGIDSLHDASYPHGDWKSILVQDPMNPGDPFVQSQGEFAGYYLSMTALQNPIKKTTDPARYVDARVVPYIVFPGEFIKKAGTGSRGDFAIVRDIRNKKESPAIVADVGSPHAPLGEVSISLAQNLGGMDVSPRTGAGTPKGPFLYVIFPKTKFRPAWPVSNDQLQSRARALVSDVGGWDPIVACLSR